MGEGEGSGGGEGEEGWERGRRRMEGLELTRR